MPMIMCVRVCTRLGTRVFVLLLSVPQQVMTFMDWLCQVKGETAMDKTYPAKLCGRQGWNLAKWGGTGYVSALLRSIAQL